MNEKKDAREIIEKCTRGEEVDEQDLTPLQRWGY